MLIMYFDPASLHTSSADVIKADIAVALSSFKYSGSDTTHSKKAPVELVKYIKPATIGLSFSVVIIIPLVPFPGNLS